MDSKTNNGSSLNDKQLKMKKAEAARQLFAAAFQLFWDASPLSMDEVAARVPCKRQYVYAIKNGNANLTLDKLAAVFNALGIDLVSWIKDQWLYKDNKELHDKLEVLLKTHGAWRDNAVLAISGGFIQLAKHNDDVKKAKTVLERKASLAKKRKTGKK